MASAGIGVISRLSTFIRAILKTPGGAKKLTSWATAKGLKAPKTWTPSAVEKFTTDIAQRIGVNRTLAVWVVEIAKMAGITYAIDQVIDLFVGEDAGDIEAINPTPERSSGVWADPGRWAAALAAEARDDDSMDMNVTDVDDIVERRMAEEAMVEELRQDVVNVGGRSRVISWLRLSGYASGTAEQQAMVRLALATPRRVF